MHDQHATVDAPVSASSTVDHRDTAPRAWYDYTLLIAFFLVASHFAIMATTVVLNRTSALDVASPEKTQPVVATVSE